MSFVLDDITIASIINIFDPLPIDLIRHAIAEQLLTVTDIGRVYEFEPYMAQARDLRQYMGVGTGNFQRIHGWTVTRSRTPENRLAQRENERHFHYMIRGYYGMADQGATELRFQRLVESICDAFRDDETDWSLSGTCEYIDPLQILRVDHTMLVGTLCHYTEILLIAHTRIDW